MHPRPNGPDHRWRAWRALPVVGLALLLPACSFEPDADGSPSTEGELGSLEFNYVCVQESDRACEATGGNYDGPFPSRIAVGAFFGLTVQGAEVIAPETSAVTFELDAFAVHETGNQVFFAVNTNKEVLDLLHIYVAAVEEIRVTADDAPAADVLFFDADESRTFRASSFDGLGSPLAGSLVYSWVSQDPSVVAVTATAANGDVTVEAVGGGSTILTVEAAGFSRALMVSVDGAVDPTDPTETETATDTATDTDGGGETGGSTGA